MKVVLYAFLLLFSISSFASSTHVGKVELSLLLTDSKGQNEEKLTEGTGKVSVDWKTKKCEVAVGDIKASCSLDTSKDLFSPAGDLVMKDIPKIQFSSDQLAAMYRGLIHEAKKNENLYQNVIDESGDALKNGLTIPFYTCGDCSKSGKDLVLFNVFQSEVRRSHQLSHSYLAGKKLLLRMTIKEMKAQLITF